MYGSRVSVLLGVAALAAVVTSTPVSQQLPEPSFTEPDMFTAMAQVAQVFLSRSKEFSQNQPFEGPVEMHLSGFSAVIRTAGEQDTKEEPQRDQPSAEALTARPAMEGYKRKGSSLYKYHTTGTDWTTAKATCEKEGAHLAIANSDDEAQLLVDLFKSKSRDAYYTNQMWVGVTDADEEGHFVTVLGEDLSSTGFSTWFEDQPDDWTFTDANGEDCVSLKEEKSLNDVHCSANIAFICEADASAWPEAPSMPVLTNFLPRRFIRF